MVSSVYDLKPPPNLPPKGRLKKSKFGICTNNHAPACQNCFVMKVSSLYFDTNIVIVSRLPKFDYQISIIIF